MVCRSGHRPRRWPEVYCLFRVGESDSAGRRRTDLVAVRAEPDLCRRVRDRTGLALRPKERIKRIGIDHGIERFALGRLNTVGICDGLDDTLAPWFALCYFGRRTIISCGVSPVIGVNTLLGGMPTLWIGKGCHSLRFVLIALAQGRSAIEDQLDSWTHRGSALKHEVLHML